MTFEQKSEQKSTGIVPQWVKDWVMPIVISLAIIIPVKLYGFDVIHVQGESMMPTLVTDERIVINKALYLFRPPQRGEIVVFQATEKEKYIKRVLALPGETIEVIGDTVYINGKPHQEPYLKDVLSAEFLYNNKDAPPFTVHPGHVFVMGDNRSNSVDSRDIGEIALEKMVGRADWVLWPFSRFGSVYSDEATAEVK